MLKKISQSILRLLNQILFKKKLPNHISIYFHETHEGELKAIEDIIVYFKNLDYKFVTIEEFNNKLMDNQKYFAFTFDDGFSSWINLLPIFEKFDVKATFYLNTIQFTDEPKLKFISDIKCSGEHELIDIEELKEIIECGHEVGAHTHSHRTLNSLTDKELISENIKNLDILSSLDVNPKNFAVPFGMRRHTSKMQIEYLSKEFNSIAFGEPGMLFKQETGKIQRYPWKVEKSFKYNLKNISTDTSIFNNLTKRSGLG
tara:strand:+ start:84 stop:857 length:774 start_codon:yes stop_codon:yes gene_type:complete